MLVCEFQEYVFACTHLALEEEDRLTSVDIILEEVARWEKPFFICGDWNDTPASYFYQNLTRHATDAYRECGSHEVRHHGAVSTCDAVLR